MRRLSLCLLAAALPAFAADPFDDYEPVENALVVAAPAPARDAADPAVQRGRYLVNLLGCASCHTDGALLGAPEEARALAGSGVGIAISDPLRVRYPAVVYPPNLTPDPEAGIGEWPEEDIVRLLLEGMGRHGGRALPVMPWQSYARLTPEDATAIARYLKRLAPNPHQVPAPVAEGEPAPAPYVHVGLYQRR
ncbi:c-type cytochrome [Pseudohaliea rubra]|uniref:Putative diheme cytochrome c-553 n=1 Tax=Pseudohaliea rubra DSM 19751 TaxID=1265313 RepID=A0A095WZ91_9GAMM|nr:c-type cytochrome [Pseudohaliea rubra]KGE03959.1 putative diheme cytochrome c-553 [Pseudohaliea rubra DSM 19751]